MVRSMTGFASGRGTHGAWSWTWDLRGVNGRGLDLRLRVPEWIGGLEAGLRKALDGALARGNVTLNLRVARDEAVSSVALNEGQFLAVLAALERADALAMERGVTLAASRAADLLAQRGVLELAEPEEDSAALAAALLADFDAVLAEFTAMRDREGESLAAVLGGQLDRIEALRQEAAAAAEARRDAQEAAFRLALSRVIEASTGVDEARVAQELALLAVKADVTEEIDRLDAHVAAARDLLALGEPVGRRLDFLTQEFNREANTLCSKAQNTELTRIGLELKAVIDQMREQVQNVE